MLTVCNVSREVLVKVKRSDGVQLFFCDQRQHFWRRILHHFTLILAHLRTKENGTLWVTG